MTSLNLGVLALVAAAPLAASAAATPQAPILGAGSHAQQVLEKIVSAHPNIDSIALYASPAGEPGTVVVASNGEKIGAPATDAAKAVLQSSKSRFVEDAKTRQLDAELVMFDMQRKPAGVVSLKLHGPGGEAALRSEALAIRDQIARRISYAANLFQAAQMDKNVPLDTYAQHLVDAALDRHRDVLILAIHATTPKNTDPEILASNIGRIGKQADDDDLRVVRDGKTNLEVNKDLMRFEVELPLNDVAGARIGALGVVFPYSAQTDQGARHADAIRIRDEISRRILKPANLVESWPYDPQFSDDTYAQQLVDETLAVHPDLLVLALHVTPPAGGTNIILASNIGRIGKAADSDDLGVVSTGKPNLAVNKAGDRFEAELVLNDASGRQIGAVSAVYAYKPGDDKTRLQRDAQGVAEELAKKIPDRAALFAPQR